MGTHEKTDASPISSSHSLREIDDGEREKQEAAAAPAERERQLGAKPGATNRIAGTLFRFLRKSPAPTATPAVKDSAAVVARTDAAATSVASTSSGSAPVATTTPAANDGAPGPAQMEARDVQHTLDELPKGVLESRVRELRQDDLIDCDIAKVDNKQRSGGALHAILKGYGLDKYFLLLQRKGVDTALLSHMTDGALLDAGIKIAADRVRLMSIPTFVVLVWNGGARPHAPSEQVVCPLEKNPEHAKGLFATLNRSLGADPQRWRHVESHVIFTPNMTDSAFQLAWAGVRTSHFFEALDCVRTVVLAPSCTPIDVSGRLAKAKLPANQGAGAFVFIRDDGCWHILEDDEKIRVALPHIEDGALLHWKSAKQIGAYLSK